MLGIFPESDTIMTEMKPPADLLQQIEELCASLPSSLPPISPPPHIPPPASVGSYIDHTLLAPTSTPSQIEALVHEAASLGTKTICVPSSLVGIASATVERLTASRQPSTTLPLPICTVGFPHGNSSSAAKVAETKQAVLDGAKEIDMVQNAGLVKAQAWEELWKDVRGVVEAAAQGGSIVKVILETAVLTRQEIAISSLIACLAGAAFVKTSTGFSTAGAKIEDIRLMHHVASSHRCVFNNDEPVHVKASGGIRAWLTMRDMILAGASRVGASGSLAILQQAASVAGSEADMAPRPADEDSTPADRY